MAPQAATQFSNDALEGLDSPNSLPTGTSHTPPSRTTHMSHKQQSPGPIRIRFVEVGSPSRNGCHSNFNAICQTRNPTNTQSCNKYFRGIQLYHGHSLTSKCSVAPGVVVIHGSGVQGAQQTQLGGLRYVRIKLCIQASDIHLDPGVYGVAPNSERCTGRP